MKKSSMKYLFVFVSLVVMAVVSLCSIATPIVPAPYEGDVLAVHALSTFRGIKSCLQSDPGTVILMRNSLVVFSWPLGEGYAFVGINSNTRTALDTMDQIFKGGNITNAKNIGEFIKGLAAAGYRQVTPSDVPPSVWGGTAVLASWLKSAASNMTTFIVIPAGAGKDFLDTVGITYQEDL